MCFIKTKQSKVLIAKRDIIVYKIGTDADRFSFIPYFIDSFMYKTGIKYRTSPNFKSDTITKGFHGYINIIIDTSNIPIFAVVQKNTKDRPTINIFTVKITKSLYVGKFIIPKGATYCANNLNEVVSNKIIYTGEYTLLQY